MTTTPQYPNGGTPTTTTVVEVPPRPSEHPNTGTDTGDLVGAGLVILAAGIILTLVHRKR